MTVTLVPGRSYVFGVSPGLGSRLRRRLPTARGLPRPLDAWVIGLHLVRKLHVPYAQGTGRALPRTTVIRREVLAA